MIVVIADLRDEVKFNPESVFNCGISCEESIVDGGSVLLLRKKVLIQDPGVIKDGDLFSVEIERRQIVQQIAFRVDGDGFRFRHRCFGDRRLRSGRDDLFDR